MIHSARWFRNTDTNPWNSFIGHTVDHSSEEKGQKGKNGRIQTSSLSKSTQVHRVVQHISDRHWPSLTGHQCHTLIKHSFYSHKESTIRIHLQQFMAGKLSTLREKKDSSFSWNFNKIIILRTELTQSGCCSLHCAFILISHTCQQYQITVYYSAMTDFYYFSLFWLRIVF